MQEVEYRICWNINGFSGHGDWFSSDFLDLLSETVFYCNAVHGVNTHRIEKRI